MGAWDLVTISEINCKAACAGDEEKGRAAAT